MTFVPLHKYVVVGGLQQKVEDTSIVSAIIVRLSEESLASSYMAIGRRIYFPQYSAMELPAGGYLIHYDDILGVDIPEGE